MKMFAVVLAMCFASLAIPQSVQAASGGKSGLTPEQKARCEAFEQNKLRNSKMPGTRKGPKFCRNA